MNVVPAQIAGVRSIALSSPPQKEFGGAVHPTILAACALLGVDEVYAVGGAQAIAMFAYGAGPCAKVDLVTGPGNIYTVTAKRLLKGQVGIDSEAGPTEIAILADDTADAAYVAADLVSQAEHDPLAAAVLVTPSRAARRRRRGRARQAGLRDQAHRADPHQPVRQPVRHRARRRPRAGPRRRQRLRRRAPRDPHRGRRRRAPPGCATPARSSSARTPRSASATTAPAPTTCCPPAAAPATQRAVGARVHQVGARRRLLAATRSPRSPTTSSRSPRPRTCPATAPRSRCGSSDELAAAPRGAAGHRAVRRARSSTSRSSSTSTRTPTARRRPARPTSPPPSRAAATTLNRYPDREFVELRAALAAYLGARRRPPSRCGRPTAPTR